MQNAKCKVQNYGVPFGDSLKFKVASGKWKVVVSPSGIFPIFLPHPKPPSDEGGVKTKF
jgi:hypothetical protein